MKKRLRRQRSEIKPHTVAAGKQHHSPFCNHLEVLKNKINPLSKSNPDLMYDDDKVDLNEFVPKADLSMLRSDVLKAIFSKPDDHKSIPPCSISVNKGVQVKSPNNTIDDGENEESLRKTALASRVPLPMLHTDSTMLAPLESCGGSNQDLLQIAKQIWRATQAP